jgi:hypothetical protein
MSHNVFSHTLFIHFFGVNQINMHNILVNLHVKKCNLYSTFFKFENFLFFVFLCYRFEGSNNYT